MATHSSVLAWRIPGTGEPGGLPSMGSHRVRHDWSDSAAAAAISNVVIVSGGQRRDSTIHIHVSRLPQTPRPSRLHRTPVPCLSLDPWFWLPCGLTRCLGLKDSALKPRESWVTMMNWSHLVSALCYISILICFAMENAPSFSFISLKILVIFDLFLSWGFAVSVITPASVLL